MLLLTLLALAVEAAGPKLKQADELTHQGHYAQAATVALDVVREAERAGDFKNAALGYVRASEANYFAGKPVEYAAQTRLALEAARRSQDAGTLGLCYYQYSYVFERTKPEQMLALLDQARPFAEQAGDRALELKIENAVGQALVYLSRYAPAQARFEHAAALARQMGDERAVGVALGNLGMIAMYRGRPVEAAAAHERAIALFEALHEGPTLANSLVGLAEARGAQGDDEGALAALERASEVWRRIDYPRGQAATLEGLADLRLQSDDDERAEALLREALGVARRGGDQRRSVRLLERLARLTTRLGRFDEAQHALDEARPEARSNGDPLLARFVALAQANLDLRRGHPAATLTDLEGLQTGSAEDGDVEGLKAQALEALGRLEPALRAYRAAVEACEARHFASAANNYRTRLARLLAQLGQPDAARSAYLQTLDDIERLDARLSSAALRRGLFAQGAEAFAGLAGLLGDQGDLDGAFAALERGRARDLRVRLLRARGPAVPPKAEEREALAQASVLLQRLERDAPAGAERRALEAELASAEERADRWRREREGRAPQLSSALAWPSAALVVAYARDGGDLLVLSRRDGRLAFRRVADAVVLLAASERFSAQRPHAPSDADGALGTRLRLAFLGPELRGLAGGRVVVLPDGALHHLPFGALPDADGAPLLARFTFSSAPSLGSLAALRTRNVAVSAAEPRVLAVGESTLGTGHAVARLAAARDEARDVARYGRGRWLADVSETALLAEHLERYDVLHFATHASIDERHPERTGLLLQTSPTDDGVLRVGEIYRLQWHALLVTVSGCSSGTGRELPGEGLLGLSHALLAAGAQSAVLSLWEVSDATTAAFMRRFYGALADFPVAEALARAQRASRAAGDPVATWAAFYVVGDGDQRVVLRRHADDRVVASVMTLLALLVLGAAAWWRGHARRAA